MSKTRRRRSEVVAAINARFPEARASISSEFAQSTNDMQTSMGMLNAIRMLALFIGGIVVANTMIMSIFERTREIGTLRAVGWRRRRILGQVLLESLFLCMVSAVFGSVLGVAVVTAIAQAPYASQFISATWSVGIFVSAFVHGGGAGRAGRAVSSLARRPARAS
jgi:putative ABC transport system permease protein